MRGICISTSWNQVYYIECLGTINHIYQKVFDKNVSMKRDRRYEVLLRLSGYCQEKNKLEIELDLLSESMSIYPTLKTIARDEVTNRWRNHNSKTTKISEPNKIIELYELTYKTYALTL